MLFCRYCGVKVAGTHKECPLCGGELSGEAEESSTYPTLSNVQSRSGKAIKIISFLSFCAAIICLAINILVPTEVFWALFAVIAVACSWLWTVVAIVKQAKVVNNIVWQLVLISVPSILVDLFTGRHGWSFDYVFPCLCIGAMIAIIVVSRVYRMPDREYIINLIICAVLGIVPTVFVFTGIVRMRIPSVICVTVSLIIIAVQLLFNWKAMYREISKKFHI